MKYEFCRKPHSHIWEFLCGNCTHQEDCPGYEDEFDEENKCTAYQYCND